MPRFLIQVTTETHDLTADTASEPIQTVIARLRDAAKGDTVSARDVFETAGQDSFATALLIVALIMVTPLSGIPTLPTLGAILIATIAVQWLVGRRHLWLPDWILRKSVDAARMRTALDWLDRPAAFVDRHTRSRLRAVAKAPLSGIALITILAIVATWPFLELLPFFTTICAVGVSLIAFGLMTQDGLWVLAGYAFFALLGIGFLTIF